jgi:signal transduction histidine kinase
MEMLVRAEGGRSVGTAVMCMLHSGPSALQIGVALSVALAVLLFMSGMLAYRISAPIRRVAAVAQRLADGDLDARVGAMRARGEVSVLATVFDRMADRIGQQLDEQKQLLAHVSHELRTPLGHLRLLVGIGREGQPIDLDELERELEELEELVAQLLARSRVDLGIVQRRQVDVLALGRRALERQGIDPAKMTSSEDELAYSLDPSLIERALANLVRNAQTHGGGLTRLSIESQDGMLVLEICDQGPGNETDGAGRGLGLGLPLARAIAEAHGGQLEQDHEGVGYRVRLVLGPGPLETSPPA